MVSLVWGMLFFLLHSFVTFPLLGCIGFLLLFSFLFTLASRVFSFPSSYGRGGVVGAGRGHAFFPCMGMASYLFLLFFLQLLRTPRLLFYQL